jgi:hypothetical protein
MIRSVRSFARRSGRLVAFILIVGAMCTSAARSVYAEDHEDDAGTCTVPNSNCDCCNSTGTCPGRHGVVCPKIISGHWHDCRHHVGTECEWSGEIEL